MKEAVSGLVLSETLEVVIPFAYAITLVIAYYGPNAEILGNIRNSYWHFQAIESLDTELSVLILMVSVDATVGLCSGLIMRIFCKINLFGEMCILMKTYWSWMALKFGYAMAKV